MGEKETLYIIIPCYNEEEVIWKIAQKLKLKIKKLIANYKINENSKILFINDGSLDKTWELILKLHENDKIFTGISLSRNMGHQNALLAGLMIAKQYADLVISMDADFQHDIDTIDKLLEKYNCGNEIVYAVAKSRKNEKLFKRVSSKGFYKFMKLLGVEVIFNHADFRLTSKKVLKELEKYNEVNLFLRGIFPLLGFKFDIVYFEQHERIAGKTKYTLNKMVELALNGITFSVRPMRLILNFGVIIFLFSIGFLCYNGIDKLVGNYVGSFSFIICSIWILSSLLLISIGIIGEYIGKIYGEVKRRPKYIIAENLCDK